MTPFKALYGYDVVSFIDLVFYYSNVPKAQNWLQESQNILKALKDNLQSAQNQQKNFADRKRTKRNFEEGDMVYLRL